MVKKFLEETHSANGLTSIAKVTKLMRPLNLKVWAIQKELKTSPEVLRESCTDELHFKFENCKKSRDRAP